MLERNHTIYVPHVGELPAKRADQLEPGDVIVTFAGTELTVKSVKKLENGKIEVLVGIRLLNPTNDIIQGNILHPEPHRQ